MLKQVQHDFAQAVTVTLNLFQGRTLEWFPG